MFRVVLVYIPLVLILVGLLFGLMKFRRTAVTLVVWMLCIEIFVLLGAFGVIDVSLMAGLLIVAGLLAISLWVALIVGSTGKPVRPAPIEVAAVAVAHTAHRARSIYDELDEDTKDKLHTAARTAVRTGLRAAAAYCRSRGWATVSHFVYKGSRSL